MPPRKERAAGNVVSDEELNTLKRWIDAEAPDWKSIALAERDFIPTDRILEAIEYPHERFRNICSLTACEVPFIRADWFLANAALPPLYHDILGLPDGEGAEAALEEKLGVRAQWNIERAPGRRVWRSGFNISGVSNYNRIVERHSSFYGAYWKSFDFSSNRGQKNIFSHPLDFKHDGGEIIFSLPNFLQAYLLVDEKGTRLDDAPINIVFNKGGGGSDPPGKRRGERHGGKFHHRCFRGTIGWRRFIALADCPLAT